MPDAVDDVAELAALGAGLHARGRYPEAIAAHRRALEVLAARQAELAEQRAALHYNLGVSLADHGALDDAAAAYQAALVDRPGWALARYNLGTLRYLAGDHAEAAAQFRAALADAPGDATVEHALALALTALGDLDGAIAAYRRVLALGGPAALDGAGHAQLALLLLRTGDAAGALPAADAALAASPDDAGAHGLRGAALATLGRHPEALAAYQRACALAPDRVEPHHNLALGLEALDRRAEAVTAYRAALAIAPDHVPSLERLVRALVELDRPGEALAPCAHLHALDPGDAITAHHLAALRGETPAAPPRAYVVDMFDAMAPRFDAVLVDTLRYRVPEAVRALLERIAPGRRFAHALDLGCGTGLLGAQLRDRCDRLDGVDLAPAMIAAARARGCYDRLALADVVEYLGAGGDAYDLIAATDVLIYLGALEPLFAAARSRLAPGGLVVASLERLDDGDLRLATTGRYQHGRGHVERLAAAHGLAVRAFDPIEVRLEAGHPVPGWLFALAG